MPMVVSSTGAQKMQFGWILVRNGKITLVVLRSIGTWVVVSGESLASLMSTSHLLHNKA